MLEEGEMSSGRGEPDLSRRWEMLYKDALFESDHRQMSKRIQLAKHAILDRLEDVTCARQKQRLQAGELMALRNAHRSLRVLEQLYLTETSGKKIA
jgi:hypothetical protein